MQEMHIYGVSFDIVGKQPIVLLKTADGNKFLPIWIGHSGGGRDPDEAPGREHAAADDARPGHLDARRSSRPG